MTEKREYIAICQVHGDPDRNWEVKLLTADPEEGERWLSEEHADCVRKLRQDQEQKAEAGALRLLAALIAEVSHGAPGGLVIRRLGHLFDRLGIEAARSPREGGNQYPYDQWRHTDWTLEERRRRGYV